MNEVKFGFFHSANFKTISIEVSQFGKVVQLYRFEEQFFDDIFLFIETWFRENGSCVIQYFGCIDLANSLVARCRDEIERRSRIDKSDLLSAFFPSRN